MGLDLLLDFVCVWVCWLLICFGGLLFDAGVDW